jgi:hypothetical protein
MIKEICDSLSLFVSGILFAAGWFSIYKIYKSIHYLNDKASTLSTRLSDRVPSEKDFGYVGCMWVVYGETFRVFLVDTFRSEGDTTYWIEILPKIKD